jgi:hypothetical protein
MSDDEPKSAIELAMERFRKQDAEQGIVERQLSDDEKRRIEEARKACRAKIAQFEIMLQSKVAVIPDLEAREVLQEEFRRDVARATADRDREIEKIHRG